MPGVFKIKEVSITEHSEQEISKDKKEPDIEGLRGLL